MPKSLYSQCALDREVAQQRLKKGNGIGASRTPRKAGKDVTKSQLPSQALKKKAKRCWQPDHTGGGLRTDDSYVFSPGISTPDTGLASLCPGSHFIIFQRCPSAGELAQLSATFDRLREYT